MSQQCVSHSQNHNKYYEKSELRENKLKKERSFGKEKVARILLHSRPVGAWKGSWGHVPTSISTICCIDLRSTTTWDRPCLFSRGLHCFLLAQLLESSSVCLVIHAIPKYLYFPTSVHDICCSHAVRDKITNSERELHISVCSRQPPVHLHFWASFISRKLEFIYIAKSFI